LKASAATALLSALPAPFIGRFALGQSKFDWGRFKGQKIDVLLVKNPRSELMQAAEKQFTELTGITVSSEQVPEQQQRQKAMIEFSSGKPTFDVAHLSMHVQKRLSEKGNWLEDLRPMLADGSMTTLDLEFNDFGKAGLDFCTAADGKQNAIPTFVDYWILYYNKELFEQKGIAYPTSMDEIFTAAQKLTDPAKGIAGFVFARPEERQCAGLDELAAGPGRGTVSKDGKLLTDTPEAIWAAEQIQAASTASSRRRARSASTGTNARQLRHRSRRHVARRHRLCHARSRTRAKSKVVGKVGYGVVPKGPKAQHSAIFGDGLGISRSSARKGAAWYYIQYITNKAEPAQHPQERRRARRRATPPSPTRGGAHIQVRQAVVRLRLESAKVGRPGLPVIIPVTEFRDVFGVALTNMISGADPAAELKKATETFKPVLEKSEQG
jgi:multiple sugar transport system substrate-binding protein